MLHSELTSYEFRGVTDIYGMVYKRLGYDCVLECGFAISIWRPFDGTRCQYQLFSGGLRKRYVNEDEFIYSDV